MVPLLCAEGGEEETQVGLACAVPCLGEPSSVATKQTQGCLGATEDGGPTEAEARVLPISRDETFVVNVTRGLDSP